MHHLFVNIMKAYDSARTEVLVFVIFSFSLPMNLVR